MLAMLGQHWLMFSRWKKSINVMLKYSAILWSIHFPTDERCITWEFPYYRSLRACKDRQITYIIRHKFKGEMNQTRHISFKKAHFITSFANIQPLSRYSNVLNLVWCSSPWMIRNLEQRQPLGQPLWCQLTHKQLGHIFSKCKSNFSVVHSEWNIVVWNHSSTMNILSPLWTLRAPVL